MFFDQLHIIAQHGRGGDDRHASVDRDLARAGLVAQLAHGFGFGADKCNAVRGAGVNEIGVFGQQAITGVDRVSAAILGDADNLFDAQVGRDGTHALADAVGFVRFKAVQRQLVLFGINRDGFLAHFVCSTHDADGDFTAVCD